VRHPIYSGGILIAVGLALLKPTSTFALACVLGFLWLIIQARLEEIDLAQRVPEYQEYLEQLPRFLPRIRNRKP
jgi:protein-S-isoprenylcysteine O-methyltransferase Ste14